MRRLWHRLQRGFVSRWVPRRMTMKTALLLALLALALATHGRFLRPTGFGLTLAGQVVDARDKEAALVEENRQLQEVYAFLQTPAGRELAARAEVLALKPGERLILLSEAARQAQKPPDTLAARMQGGMDSVKQLFDKKVERAKRIGAEWAHLGSTVTKEASAQPAPAAPIPSNQ